jgi:hypothetical protein
VVSKGIVIDDDTVAFFGWRQDATSRNIENNGIIRIVVVSEAQDRDTGLKAGDTLRRKARFPTAYGNFRSNLKA